MRRINNTFSLRNYILKNDDFRARTYSQTGFLLFFKNQEMNSSNVMLKLKVSLGAELLTAKQLMSNE